MSLVTRLPPVLLAAFAINLPLGYYRAEHDRFSIPWWLLIHASIPILVPLRKFALRGVNPGSWGKWVIPMNIAVAVMGQWAGGKLKGDGMGNAHKGEG